MRCTSRFVVYPGSVFVLWILMNQSFQSPYLEVGMVSLLYDSATEQRAVFVHNFKLHYMSTCRQHVRIFLPIYVNMKKRSRRQPYSVALKYSRSLSRHKLLLLLYVRIIKLEHAAFWNPLIPARKQENTVFWSFTCDTLFQRNPSI